MTPKTLIPPAFVAPLALTFPLDDEELTVTAMGVAQIAQALVLCAPVLDDLLSLADDTLARLQAGEPNSNDLLAMFELVRSHGEAGFDLVAIATGREREWVGRLLPDRFAWLFAVVVQVNADFFSRARAAFSAAGALLAKAHEAPPAAASTGRPSSTP